MEYRGNYFIKKVDENLICSVCHDIFLNPVSCKDGHTFCSECIKRWLKSSNRCPVDNGVICVANLTRNYTVSGVIENLEVYCQYFDSDESSKRTIISIHIFQKDYRSQRVIDVYNCFKSQYNRGLLNGFVDNNEYLNTLCMFLTRIRSRNIPAFLGSWNGLSYIAYCISPLAATTPFAIGDLPRCKWVGKLYELPIHKKSCLFQREPCRHANCNSKVMRKEMEDHVKTCMFRNVECEECKHVLVQKDLEKHKEEECPETLLPCPNKCTIKFRQIKKLKRTDLKDHLTNICAKTEVNCPFNDQGCPVLVERQDVDKHVQENMAAHMKLLAKQNSDLQKELTEFQRELGEMFRGMLSGKVESICDGYVWTIEDFPSLSQNHPTGSLFRSPSFWSCGHKWYINVYPNGDERSQGDVTIYLRLSDEGALQQSDDPSIVPNAVAFVSFSLSVVSQKQDKPDVCFEIRDAKFDKSNKSWGETFMKADEALSYYCNEGTLIIQCGISIASRSLQQEKNNECIIF